LLAAFGHESASITTTRSTKLQVLKGAPRMKLRVALLVFCFASVLSFADTLAITGQLQLTATSTTFPGNFTVDAGSTGIFAPLDGTTGSLQTLTYAAQPLNQALSLSNFVTLPGSDYALDLTFRPLGTFSSAQCNSVPAAGQTCTPMEASLVTPSNPQGLSDLNLTNLNNVVAIAFDATGELRQISTGDTSPFTGIFTVQIVGQNYQDILATLGGGGTVSDTYFATFTADAPVSGAPVPEPASLLMLAGGLVGLTGYRRTKRS
jgi:hypothetical protein